MQIPLFVMVIPCVSMLLAFLSADTVVFIMIPVVFAMALTFLSADAVVCAMTPFVFTVGKICPRDTD